TTGSKRTRRISLRSRGTSRNRSYRHGRVSTQIEPANPSTEAGGHHETGTVSDFRARRAGSRTADRSRRSRYFEGCRAHLHAAIDGGTADRLIRPTAPGVAAASLRGRGLAARIGAAACAAAAARQDPVLHRQLLGTCATGAAAAQHVLEESR